MWELTSNIRPDDLLVLATTVFVSATSFFMYRSDGDSRFFTGKDERINEEPKTKLLINTLFYSLISIMVLSAFSEGVFLLSLWDGSTMKIIGSSVAISGSGLFALSKISLGSSYTPCFNSFVPRELVDGGIYSVIRHPIYTSNALVFLGAFLATGSMLVLPMLLILGNLYRKSARLEEAMLSKALVGYGDYMARTSAFIPLPGRLRGQGRGHTVQRPSAHG